MFTISYKVNAEYEKDHLLDSFFFPVQMAMSWTYPPGQYVFHPFFINEKDAYYKKIGKARAISATLNLIGVFCFLYLLYLLNQKKITPNTLIPFAIYTFSYTAILYSHHMSPYALLPTTYVIALILFYHTLSKKLNYTALFTFLGFLTIMNYLILLLVPVFGCLIILNHKLRSIQHIIKEFWKSALAYGVIFFPFFVLSLKLSNGMRGVLPVSFFPNPFLSLFHLSKQFVLTFSSAIACFTTLSSINITLSTVILCSSLYFISKKTEDTSRYIYLSVFFFFGIWIGLYQLEKLVMDQTRHVIMWGVSASLLIALIVYNLKIHKYILYITTLLILGFSVQSNMHLLEQRKTVFDFDLIDQQNPQLVLSIDNWNSVLYYADTKTRSNILFTPEKLLRYLTTQGNLPDKIIIVSQEQSWAFFFRNHAHLLKQLEEHYTVRMIKEISTGIYFPYNNYRISTNENGFYLYEIIRKRHGN